MAVPEGRFATGAPLALKRLARRFQEIVSPQESIGPLCEGNRPLGVFSQRGAGNTQVGGLLLYASGVCDRQGAADDQAHELDVAQWLGGMDPRAAGNGLQEPEVLESLAGPRMNGKHHMQLVR